MKHIVLGTAGHIDHGKTSLVKALTGIDTDRLKEEKERGITIDLGFAYRPLPSGIVLSIVDVPGHERFVRNMIAGAAGIDIVLLVIAADDGVMPQTREHLEICTLLGVKHGLVAVTKSDLVDSEWLALTVEEIGKYFKGTFLDGSPVIPVSSVSGKGVDELVSAIDALAGKITRRKAEGIFRMPVDRSFTVKGFGTVVTGTPVSGKIKAGEEVEVLPGGLKARIRGVQTHGKLIDEGTAGSRVALNLQGVEREAVSRGDTIASPGVFETAETVEAEITLLSSAPRPLKDGAEPMLHIYSASTVARLSILDKKEVKPGEKALVRIRSKNPIVAAHGNRFVLRTPDGGTIGGGIVLDSNPPRRNRKQVIEEITVLSSGDLKAKSHLLIKRTGMHGISLRPLALRLNADLNDIDKAVTSLVKDGTVVRIDENLVSADAVKALRDAVVAELKEFHKKEPMKEGLPREELRARLRVVQKLLGTALEGLVKDRAVIIEKDVVRMASHKISGGETKDKIEKLYIESGLTPPTQAELLEKLKIKERESLDLLHLLAKEGKLAKVKDLFFSKKSIDDLEIQVTEFLKAKGEMTPVDFKDLTGLSRKFAIPLLEYLDSQKITIRVGDVRKLRKG